MRTIPVTFNHDHMRVIGRLELDDISDKDIINCSISWYTDVRDNSLLGITLIPAPKAIIENDPPEPFLSKVEQSMPPDERDRRVD